MISTHSLQLSFDHLSIDPDVARRLPRGLAQYYLALPIGMDDGTVTVAMVHPTDRAAISLLESVLKLPVVPVQGSAPAIREALSRIWHSQEGGPSQVLYWGHPSNASSLALRAASALGAGITHLEAHEAELETALTAAREGDYTLLVVEQPEGSSLSRLAREATIPVLALGGNQTALRRILLVLRGHAPDERTLDWLIPVAQSAGASITLLVVTPPLGLYRAPEQRPPEGLATFLDAETESGEHLFSCARRLSEADVVGSMKLREGSPRQQIAAEVAESSYDLIAITAEAYGEFVGDVLSEVEARSLHVGRSVLIMKPSLPLRDEA